MGTAAQTRPRPKTDEQLNLLAEWDLMLSRKLRQRMQTGAWAPKDSG